MAEFGLAGLLFRFGITTVPTLELHSEVDTEGLAYYYDLVSRSISTLNSCEQASLWISKDFKLKQNLPFKIGLNLASESGKGNRERGHNRGKRSRGRCGN